jgi:hypothetical protein
MSVDHVGRGPWWTSHHGRYRAPRELGHGPFRALRTCRDSGERKRMTSRFYFASYWRREGDRDAARQSSTVAIGVHWSGEGSKEEVSWWPKWMRGGSVKVWALLYSLGMAR